MQNIGILFIVGLFLNNFLDICWFTSQT